MAWICATRPSISCTSSTHCRDRLKRVDCRTGAVLAHEERKHTNIRTDIEDARAWRKRDAVPHIGLLLEDLAVEKPGLVAVQLRDQHAVGQLGAGALIEPAGMLQLQILPHREGGLP